MAKVSAPICTACGSEFAEAEKLPESCPICQDDRQFVPPSGQAWTTLDAISRKHFNSYRYVEPAILGMVTTPQFAIGQRALLIRTPQGNLLWECLSLLDQATVDIVKGLGGIAGIAISHPHYYSTMVEWSREFNAPIHLHAADKKWVMRPDSSIQFWEGDTKPLFDGLTLIRCGGHFAGATVLHSQKAGNGSGAIMTGDVVMVVPNRNHVSFMRSYPNLLPLSAPSVQAIGDVLAPFKFEAIYGAFFDRDIRAGGKQIIERSVKRYIDTVRGDGSAERL